MMSEEDKKEERVLTVQYLSLRYSLASSGGGGAGVCHLGG